MKKLLLTFLYSIAACALVSAQGWQPLGTGSNALKANNAIAALCWDNGLLYAGGYFTDSLLRTSGSRYVAVWNGGAWSRVGIEDSLLRNFNIRSICADKYHNIYKSGVILNTVGDFCVAKWDGSSWKELGTGINALHANNAINTICSDPAGNIYAAGLFTDADSPREGHYYVAKWDGHTWSKLGTGANDLNANDQIDAIAADSSGNIYAAGHFRLLPWSNTYVAKWDGATWKPLGEETSDFNYTIDVLHIDDIGNVYAGGYFTNSTGKYYVAKWNMATNQWSELGSGAGALNAIHGIYSICSDKLGNIYAAGHLTNSTLKYYVARYDGANWNELGNGRYALNANSSVEAVAVDSLGDIFAAGDFTDSVAYPKGYRNVVKYDHRFLAAPSLVVTNERNITVFPNPSSGRVNFKVAANMIGSQYKIIDVAGTTKYEGRFVGSQIWVDLSFLPKGVYLLSVLSAQNINSTFVLE